MGCYVEIAASRAIVGGALRDRELCGSYVAWLNGLPVELTGRTDVASLAPVAVELMEMPWLQGQLARLAIRHEVVAIEGQEALLFAGKQVALKPGRVKALLAEADTFIRKAQGYQAAMNAEGFTWVKLGIERLKQVLAREAGCNQVLTGLQPIY